MTEPKIYLMADVMRDACLSRSTIHKYVTNGSFPKPFKMGNKNAWFESVITAWVFDQFEKGQGDGE